MSNATLGLPDDLHQYLLTVGVREPDLLLRLRDETAKLPMAQMQIAPEQGALMGLLAELIGARRYLEIGTFTGYSALTLALALPPRGKIVCCDLSEEWTAIARRHWQRAGVAHKIELVVAPALATLDARLAGGESGSYDFAFIDADKTGYHAYYERLLRLVRPGGLIAVNDLKAQRKTLPRGIIGLARCPFFAHLKEPIMQAYIKRDLAAFGAEDYPDDWACMYYDALGGLVQGAAKAKSVATEGIVKALKGATIDTCRGKRTFRTCSNQLDVPSYVGEVWDSPDYPFPIYKPDTMILVEGHEVWTPTCAEVDKLKKKRA